MHTAYESTDTVKVLSDEQIIQLYWDRNETAITATDEKYGRYLYTIAYNVLHDRLDCEECLNDTYLGTWNRIPPTRPAAFMVFLSKIMKNIAVDRHRKNTAEKRVPGELDVQFIEIMGCPGGCVNGGGQPIQPASVRMNMDLRAVRASVLYNDDANADVRKSQDNLAVQKIYDEYLGAPNSHKAHEILHTTYVKRGL